MRAQRTYRGAKTILSCWILFFFAGVLTCGRDERKEEPPSTFAIALWSEFSPLEKVKNALPLLKAHSLGLYQAVHTENLEDPSYRDALKDLFQESVRLGLDTRAWILLPYSQGYWPNEENREAFIEKAQKVMDWFQNDGIPITWIVVDMEPSYQMTQRLLDASTSRDLSSLLSTFLEQRNPERFLRAVADFSEWIPIAHRKGFRVLCVTFPLVLDDLEDGDDDLQDLLNLPVRGVPWDELSFMVYRTTAYDLGLQGVSSYFVYSYARSAFIYFGERAGIDIGLVAPPGTTDAGGWLTGYTSPQPLREDLMAVLSAGIRKIHIWPLDHLILYENFPEWVNSKEIDPGKLSPPPPDSATEGLRFFLALLDKALDAKKKP